MKNEPCQYMRYTTCEHGTKTCPVNDPVFSNALTWYVVSGPKIKCLLGSMVANKGVLSLIFSANEVTSDDIIELEEIANLFPDHAWADKWAEYSMTDGRGKLRMDQELCRQLRAAHKRWRDNLAPPGYRWRGKP